MKMFGNHNIQQSLAMLLIGLWTVLIPLASWGQLFQQDFATNLTSFSNSNSANATYINASPSNSQFTYLGSSGTGSTIAVIGGKLNFNRTGNGWGVARGSSFTGSPTSLLISFEFTNVTSGGATTSPLVFAVGGGVSNGASNTSLTNADVHSRLAFNQTANNGEFVVRDIAASVNGATTFSGSQMVLFAVNNSGGLLTYRAPDGTYETIANDRFDVWVGTNKQLDERSATTASQTLSFFKCISTSGTANVTFDNLLIDPIPAIPTSNAASDLTPSSFKANWSTVTGVTGYRIDVATDAAFTSMVPGWSDVYVAGQGTSSIIVNIGLSPNTTYFYRVRGASQYSIGEFAGGNSSGQSVTTSIGCTSPSIQAAFFTSNTITTSSATISVTRGNGNNVLIIARDGTAITTNPSSGTAYLANQTFGSGDLIGSGWAVYNNSGAGANASTGNISLTNLSSGTTYHFAAYEYNTVGSCYNITTPAIGSFTTICSAPTSITPVTVGSKSFTATWGAVTGATGYSLDYSTVADFSSAVTTIENIVGTSQVITGLNYNTQYYFRVRAINAVQVASANSNISTTTTLTAASSLVLVGVPGAGFVDTYLSGFTVEARRANSTVDDAYVSTVTLSKVSGSGNIVGTLTAIPINGIATFEEVSFDAASTYIITAGDGTFTSVNSGNIVISTPTNAASVVWNGTGGSAAWLTAGNWVGGAVPSATQVAQFASITSSGNTVGINMNTLGGATSVGGFECTSARTNPMTIGNNSGANGVLTINGVVINLIANVMIRNNSTQLLTIQNNVSGSSTMGVALGNITDNKIVIDGTGGITISSVISGANKLTKQGSGSGVLQLTGANTYTGLTTVLAGTLQLNRVGGTTIPSTNNVTVSGGALRVSTNQTLNNLVLNGGILTVDNGTTLTINGTFTYTSGSFSGSGTIVYGGSGELIYNGPSQQITTDMEWPSVDGPAAVIIGTNGVILHAGRTINGALTLHGILTLGANQLSVAGVLAGNGRLRGSSLSRITFTGSGGVGVLKMDQTSAETRTLSNLTVNRTGGGSLVIGDSLIITDSLNLHNGVFFTGGLVKLASSATKTAVISELKGTATINGAITMEQFVSSAGRRWRFVGSPFSDATFEDWRQELFITGAGTGTIVGTLNSNGFDASGSNQPGVYSYNETVAGDLNLGWEPLTNNTPSLSNKPIVLGKGYRMFVRGDRSDWGRLTGTVNTQNAVTLNLTGTVHTGDFSFDSLISYTSSGVSGFDGWNLVANPYPCGYDWNAFRDDGTNLSNIDSTIWIYDATTGGYKSYNANSGGSLEGGIIPPGASFWVKANASNPTMVFKESFKRSLQTQSLFKKSESNELNLKLILDTVTSDIFQLAHYPASLSSADAYDVRKISGTINLFSKGTDGVELAYDARPQIPVNDTIHLWVSGGTNTYRLEVNSLPQSGRLYVLIDKKTNTTFPLIVGTVYSFSTLSVDSSSYGNRFNLIVMGSSPLPILFLSFKATKDFETTQLEWKVVNESHHGQYQIQRSVNAVDWEVIGVVKQKRGLDQHLYQYTDAQPVLGAMNYYRILYEADEKIYSLIQSVNFMEENLIQTTILSPNPTSQFLTIESFLPIASASIKDMNGREVLITTEKIVDTSSLTEGLYIVVVTDINGNQSSHKLHIQH